MAPAEPLATTAALPALDLRNRWVAGILAWLIPGAGHFYQRRTGKGCLYLVCILGTFFFGLYLGGEHVVYASWPPDESRLPYLCQIGVGLPAMPALVQAELMRNNRDPITGFMAPPRTKAELSKWHFDLNRYFEFGMVYTMIAGLLNVLAIYDAAAGPVPPEEASDDEDAEADPAADSVP